MFNILGNYYMTLLVTDKLQTHAHIAPPATNDGGDGLRIYSSFNNIQFR